MALWVGSAGEAEYGGGGDGYGDAVGDDRGVDLVAGVFIAGILSGDWI